MRLLHHAPVESLQCSQLLGASHQRGLASGRQAPDGMLGDQADGLPGRNPRGLALELERLEHLVAHGSAGGPHGALAHSDAGRTSGALQPGGHVDGVAHHRVGLTDGAGQHLAGVDPHAQREVHPLGQALVDLAHRVLHPEARAHRALRIVLVGHRGAEDRHHVVADVLVDRAAEALHLAAEAQQRTVDE